MSFIGNASRRGWIYSGEILFNRLVPSRLFRCRRFVVYRLKVHSKLEPSEIRLDWCQTDEQLTTAEQLSHFQRVGASGPVRAVLATHNRQPVGSFWAASGSFDESDLGLRIKLSPKQTWLFAAMVEKEKRGLGIYSGILRFITSELGAEGFDDLLVAVNPMNKPSNHVHKNSSVETIGYVNSIRIVNWAWCFSSRKIQRKSGFTTNAKYRPIEISIPKGIEN